MSKINHADAIRKLAIQYQSMVAAADALESIGSIEQATQEAHAALIKAREELEKVNAELAKSRNKVRQANNEADEVLDEARQQVTPMIEAAKQDAKRVADATIKRAETRARKIEDEAAARYKAAVEQENTTRNALAEMQAEMAALAEDVERAKAEHARISALIVELRSKLGA